MRHATVHWLANNVPTDAGRHCLDSTLILEIDDLYYAMVNQSELSFFKAVFKDIFVHQHNQGCITLQKILKRKEMACLQGTEVLKFPFRYT